MKLVVFTNSIPSKFMKFYKTPSLIFSILRLIVVNSLSCKEKISSKDNPEIHNLKRQGKNKLSDTAVSNPYETNTIYEIGKTVTNYEDNFINLFENWRTQNISNANEYKLISFSFVETISDSAVFRRYRNYFTGDKPIGNRIKSRSNSSSNGNKISYFFVYPAKRHQFL